MELGDLIETALSSIGVTKEKVSDWLGRECGCEERKQKLNQLSIWARRVLKGKPDYLEKILEEQDDRRDERL